METELSDGMRLIVSKFTQLVKSLMQQAEQIQSPEQVRPLEQSLRDHGRSILQSLLQQVLQSAVDRRQESLRTCPHCSSNRRHQGVRSRQLDSSLGRLVLTGIYWRCPCCFWHQHSVDSIGDEPVTLLMKDLMVLAGVSSTSFDKAQIVTRHLLGVDADDEAIRHLCLKAGGGPEQSRIVATPVCEGGELIGSCDGTMINTREDRWREVKALRFEHAGGSYAAAYLENAASFVPRLKKTAERLAVVVLHGPEASACGAGPMPVSGQARGEDGLPPLRAGGNPDPFRVDGELLQAAGAAIEGAGDALERAELGGDGNAGVPVGGGSRAVSQLITSSLNANDRYILQLLPLDTWIELASGSDAPSDLRSFARGLTADLAAVRAALTQPWSNGQVEGQVNRLKLVKRQIYGRAGFDLLRARFLHAV